MPLRLFGKADEKPEVTEHCRRGSEPPARPE